MSEEMPPRFKAGNARLRALFDHVYKLNGSKPIQMETVADWALKNGLYPVPMRGCSKAEAIDWERRFDAACEQTEEPKE